MANPLDRQPANHSPTLSLAEWCHEHNLRRLTERMRRWYYVSENDGGEFIDCLEGDDGENVRRFLDGKLADFDGWPKARIDGYRKWMRTCANRGLLPERLAA